MTSIFSLLRVIGLTAYYSVHCVTASKGNSDKFLALTVEWSNKLIDVTKTKLEVYGRENLPSSSSGEKNSYVYVANHNSLMDIPVAVAALNDNIRIIYKQELERIPIFGYGMKKSPYIATARGNGKSASESLNLAVAEMKKNKSILIFPEGTRSLDGKVGKFHRGAFLMASKAEKLLVPVCICGTSEVLPKSSFRLGTGKTVKVFISAPVEVPNGSRAEMLAFMESVRNTIAEQIEKEK